MTDLQPLIDEVTQALAPILIVVRPEEEAFIVDLAREDGTVLWPTYAIAPTALLATLKAEQRYLVEQEGRGSVRGATYAEKAAERLRRFSASSDQ